MVLLHGANLILSIHGWYGIDACAALSASHCSLVGPLFEATLTEQEIHLLYLQVCVSTSYFVSTAVLLERLRLERHAFPKVLHAFSHSTRKPFCLPVDPRGALRA